MPQKIYILIIILTTFASFAFTARAEVGNIDTSKDAVINIAPNNIAKLCLEVTCQNYEIIDFKISGDSPLVIDTEKGFSGKVWGGNGLGWISFNPPYGGVFFANSKTGLLKGTAWSETSGAINFSVTGQKVTIDPKTGEWNGWAWASGPYGGWIKFDCQDASCIRTTWRYKTTAEAAEAIPPPTPPTQPPPESSTPPAEGGKAGEIISKVLNNFFDGLGNLFNGIRQLADDAFNSVSLSFKNLSASFFGEIAKINGSTFSASWRELNKINGSAFTTSISNIKYFSNQMADMKYQFFDIIGQKFNNTYYFVASFLKNIHPQNSLVNKNEIPTSTIPSIVPVSEVKEKITFDISKDVEEKISTMYNSLVFNLNNQVPTNKNLLNETPSKIAIITDTQLPEEFPSAPGMGEKIKNVVKEKSEIINNTFDIFISRSADLFNKTEQMTSNTYNSISSYLMDLRNSFLNK